MTVGELKRMIDPFSNDRQIKLKKVIEIIGIDEDYTEEVCDMEVVSLYGKELMCIVELKEVEE